MFEETGAVGKQFTPHGAAGEGQAGPGLFWGAALFEWKGFCFRLLPGKLVMAMQDECMLQASEGCLARCTGLGDALH